ncbi:hypothetical protein AVEN_162012-1 [Araneus ventricosus]|uniref:Uncharacterized protein n=1 Tax=Araneus ventricosus TaxID=182803 RepID=A0A4Y2F7X9_ARAVE|nr:hypothetical protein AVEN_162012-1 [Araneus ventricosus]
MGGWGCRTQKNVSGFFTLFLEETEKWIFGRLEDYVMRVGLSENGYLVLTREEFGDLYYHRLKRPMGTFFNLCAYWLVGNLNSWVKTDVKG